MVDLGTLGGTDSGAYAVNDSGQVVGYSTYPTGEVHAVLWPVTVPVKVWVGLKNSDDVGIRFDLQAKAYLNGSLSAPGRSTASRAARADSTTRSCTRSRWR